MREEAKKLRERQLSAKKRLDELKELEEASLPTFAELKKLHVQPDKHMCERCVEEYDAYNAKQRAKDPEWEDRYPNCKGSLEAPSVTLSEYSALIGVPEDEAVDEYDFLRINEDPVLWGAAQLDIITDGVDYDRDGEEISANRWYQRDMLRCSAQFKAYRCGRRTGKTFSMRWETLHFMITNKDMYVLLVCPYEKQVIAFLKDIDKFIEHSPELQRMVKHRSKSKHTITFNNGSHLEAVMTGGDKAGGGAKARGQEADLMVFDEVDYIAPNDIEAAIAILADNPKCKILCSSTPTGKREFFFNVCSDKSRRYKEFHMASHVSPVYNQIADDEVRAASSSAAYRREMLGEFGDEATGVFSQVCIDKSLKAYSLLESRKKGPQPNWIYMVGVDWNGAAIGVHCVVVGFNPQSNKYKLVDKIVVANETYTQTTACSAIVNAFEYWNASHIYADFGAGETQSELIRRHATNTGKKKLADNFKPIPMQGSTEVRNPASGLMEKKNNQQLGIDLLAHHLEEGWIELPASEDFMGGDEAEMGLVCQMRHFAIEKISVGGKPKYVGVDHTLTGYYLTMLAFQVEKSSMGQTRYDNSVCVRASGDSADGETVRGVMEREKDKKKEKGLAPGMIMSRSFDSAGKINQFGSITGVGVDGDEVKMEESKSSIKGQVAMRRGRGKPMNVYLHKRGSF